MTTMTVQDKERILEAYRRRATHFKSVASRRQTSERVEEITLSRSGIACGDLSGRELEVLALLAEGLSNEQVGARLIIGSETVKTHVRHILEKLGASNRAHAVGIAYRDRLLGWPRLAA
jgi:ATP/maltotriose-dependent transcriptional regulator MalT